MKLHVLGAAASLALATAGSANAAIVLTFEGVGDLASVDAYYNGGTDSLGNSGANLGVSFVGAVAGVDSDAGGSANIANEPSASTIIAFLNTPSAILNYAAGFDTGFSFFYSSTTAATVNVYDGLNATGNLLGSINLAAQANGNGCVGDPNGGFCNWTPIGVAFAGVAKSIDFGGGINATGYDNITFGAATPGGAPEPAAWALMLAGFGLAGAALRRRGPVGANA